MDDAVCKACGQKLMLIHFSKGAYLVCNNWNCRLDRDRQHIVIGGIVKGLEAELEIDMEEAPRKRGSSLIMAPPRSRYRDSYLEAKRLNYEALRARGYGCKDARDNCTIKKARAILGT